MDSFSFFKAFAKATHETTSYAPLDNNGNRPFCLNPFYEIKNRINDDMDEVECLNCNKIFFVLILRSS